MSSSAAIGNTNDYVVAVKTHWSPSAILQQQPNCDDHSHHCRDEKNSARNTTFGCGQGSKRNCRRIPRTSMSVLYDQTEEECKIDQDDQQQCIYYREYFLNNENAAACDVAMIDNTIENEPADFIKNSADLMELEEEDVALLDAQADDDCVVSINAAEKMYDEMEALLFGLNKCAINHQAALERAKRYPRDPVMVAIQAVLLQMYQGDEPCASKSQDLWERAKHLGLLDRAQRMVGGFAKTLGCRMLQCTSEEEGKEMTLESITSVYAEAAQRKQASAMFFLGNCHEESRRDFETAKEWYEKAALQGHAMAQTALGKLYRKNMVSDVVDVDSGIQRDQYNHETAMYWFQLGATQGDADAQVNLAFLYYNTGDARSAKYWYDQATKDGRHVVNILDRYLGSSSCRERADKKDSEQYLYEKAQANLSQLFVQGSSDNDNNSVYRNREIVRQNKRQLSSLGGEGLSLFSKMRCADLNSSETNYSEFNLLSIATLNSLRGLSSTATHTSMMSLQNLSISSLRNFSPTASVNSIRQAITFMQTQFDFEDHTMTGSSLIEHQRYLMGNTETASRLTEERMPASDVCDAEMPSFSTTCHEEDSDTTSTLSIRTSKIVSKSVLKEADVIQPFYAVLGDKSARGVRVTTGTKELREAKEWYRENKIIYQKNGRQLDLFTDAMERYYSRMAELFEDFPTSKVEREQTLLIYCSERAMQSDRVQKPHCFRHANDKQHQYGTAKVPEAVLFYFNNRDPPKVETEAAKYRRKLLQMNQPDLTSDGRREYFEQYLDFCEMTLRKAAEGCPAAQLAVEKHNFIPTMKALWDDLENKREER